MKNKTSLVLFYNRLFGNMANSFFLFEVDSYWNYRLIVAPESNYLGNAPARSQKALLKGDRRDY